MKTALFIMLNEYTDWEDAYLSRQLNQDEGWQVKTASLNLTVTSIGYLTTKIDYQLSDLPSSDLLILIRGNSWNAEKKSTLIYKADFKLFC
ncbi:hypothetical protein [Lactiplantibacillus paraplantarum]|uniref:hypothetical protein n=1 Tax=Lactiplantibacillus paraplantarum TaxID=60520 RepID=UPI0023AAEB4E|nr:hypothetical protein [Lactiplantibacillus paraplantarum]WEE35638.1 hypothetical protein PWO93_13205 [Lactiplantibacillus paraplantarum]